MTKCKTHIVGDILWYKTACYTLVCTRCDYTEVIGTWHTNPAKQRNRYVWSVKQWPAVRAAINALEAVQDFSYRSSSTKD